ncbi:EH domain-binding protein 1 isoform X1 [Bombus vosnesenskii]|uniref:EH domain-binding protein 1 isoform X1 n=2 Tax=Bombus vosnesenskii TaxID=207650 RepID=A0A6J3KTR8_9HYME|nr:EH domain-binding protein 1 isoform X1 [Bombus vosnesenskii]XP_033356463.1 EH domain-binding protein 1 isoform X1 [Bombus vosnesenskii]
MGEKRGTKALEFWCRRITEGYPDVNVQNMTTSWRDGLAFCAMIHHFRPDLIDFDSLDKNDIYGNNELAFRIAEQHLGIPALLDAEDMASCAVPDRLSILTYLSQFYQTFSGSSPARIPASRTTETVEERITQVSESPKEKEATCLGSMRKDVCVVCGFPIFLAEKLVLAHVAYHRTCFRCARCNNQLTIGNYYETEEGQYCCETCPDEDIAVQITQSYDYPTYSEIEKSDIDSGCQQFFSNDENVNKKPFSRNSIERMDHESMDRVVIPDLIAQTSRLRLNFISNQLFSENDEQMMNRDDNMRISENRSSIEGDDTNLKTESRNLVHPFNTEYEKRSKLEEENKLSCIACLKLEPDNDGLLNTNVHDYVHERLNIDKHEQDQITITSVASLHNVIKETRASHSNDKELSDETSSESNYSIVEKRRRMFEKKKDDIERNKLKTHDTEALKFKIQTKRHRTKSIGNSESPIINPDTTMQETDIGQNNSRKYNAESFDKDSSTQIAPFELSSSRVSKVNKTLSIPLDTESIEHHTSTVANDINATNVICSNFSEDYPEDLNPFKSDEEQEELEEAEEAAEMEEEKEKEEEEEEEEDEEGITDKSVTTMNSLEPTRDLTNPFENVEETDKKEVILPIPATRSNFKSGKANQHFVEGSTKRRLAAPQINLNPFWSDEEDHDSDLEFKERTSEIMPTPKPRTIKHNEQSPSKNGRKSSDTRDYLSISSNYLRSPESGIRTGGAYRKKKPAPLPPNKKECVSDQRTSSMSKLQCSSAEYLDSPSHKTFKTRKPRPAPPPPIPVSSGFKECPMNKSHDASVEYNIWEDEKTNKDETNRNRQSFPHITCEETFHCRSYLDKSMEGKWKRKKGPAPPCPIPHRRKIKVMSLKDVKLELDEIELQQQGLEKQGVRLEQLIRSKCESGPQISDTTDISLGTDVEELVLELFTLVNEKNELFRRQAELMLLRRQQRLEEEHAEVEYQIRCLMAQNESTKTDFDKQREEALIQRLIEIVERRNEIVDCLEMDRRREIEEDRSIHRHMDLFAAKNKNDISCNDMDTTEKKKRKQNKLKEKIKEKRLKRILKKDVDKDVDEMELTLKRHTKRKWF